MSCNCLQPAVQNLQALYNEYYCNVSVMEVIYTQSKCIGDTSSTIYSKNSSTQVFPAALHRCQLLLDHLPVVLEASHRDRRGGREYGSKMVQDEGKWLKVLLHGSVHAHQYNTPQYVLTYNHTYSMQHTTSLYDAPEEMVSRDLSTIMEVRQVRMPTVRTH